MYFLSLFVNNMIWNGIDKYEATDARPNNLYGEVM